jgi:hypothetical protein
MMSFDNYKIVSRCARPLGAGQARRPRGRFAREEKNGHRANRRDRTGNRSGHAGVCITD